MALVDDFMVRYPEFTITDPVVISRYETILSTAGLYITASIYGQFTQEALFAKAASMLYQSNNGIQSIADGVQVLSRSVSGEYSVSYANSFTSDGKRINPYLSDLQEIQKLLGLSIGGLLYGAI